ncbi:hypothetical protein HZC30_07620 [Candidatus Woesearchaeota archaeon]|nr:hypothetical protein [Candidatus Woesearchaeota archaeon]
MTALTSRDLKTLHQAVLRAEQIIKYGVQELSDCFAENPRLKISPSNQCTGACLHCVSDSTLTGKVMPYEDFSRIDPRFFQMFSAADFGRSGNPLLYHSGSCDMVDLMRALNDNGINKFSSALALQTNRLPEIRRLEELVSEKGAEIRVMVTYHHYHDNLDPAKLASDFNSTLKQYFGFSKRITISLLGDSYPQQGSTKAEEVKKTFHENWSAIFADIEITLTKNSQSYFARYNSKEAKIKIPSVNTRVYPLGRFREYLSGKGILTPYEEHFRRQKRDYACPDLLKWSGLLIEPDGSVNLCASFESMYCRKAVVANIFTEPYSEVERKLREFHHREMKWFVRNIEGIISGTVPTCKLRS